MKIDTSGTIKAPMQLVFSCLTDIQFLKDESRRGQYERKLKIRHDRKGPFEKNKKIFFVQGKFSFIISVLENNERDHLTLLIEPSAEYKEALGTFTYEARLTESGAKTKYTYVLSSSKDPIGIFKLAAFIAKPIIWLSIWRTKRRFAKFIKSKHRL